jgi:XPG I-region
MCEAASWVHGRVLPMQAPSEAEAQCAALCKAGAVYAMASEDMDSLTFATPRLTRNLLSPASAKQPVTEYEYDKVLRHRQDCQFSDVTHSNTKRCSWMCGQRAACCKVLDCFTLLSTVFRCAGYRGAGTQASRMTYAACCAGDCGSGHHVRAVRGCVHSVRVRLRWHNTGHRRCARAAAGAEAWCAPVPSVTLEVLAS